MQRELVERAIGGDRDAFSSLMRASAPRQLAAPPLVAEAQAANTVALVAVITTLGQEITKLGAELVDAFGRHPDAEILRSLPGLGGILGARVFAQL